MAMAIAQSSVAALSSMPSTSHLSAPSCLSYKRRTFHVTCHSPPESTPSGSGGGCCGGSGSTSTSGSCSSHGKAASSLAKVGKEFEQMVASATLLEYEKNYITRPMEGTISRDIIEEVVRRDPEEPEGKSEEKFLDVNALLDEARNLSNGDFIFSDDSEDMVLI